MGSASIKRLFRCQAHRHSRFLICYLRLLPTSVIFTNSSCCGMLSVPNAKGCECLMRGSILFEPAPSLSKTLCQIPIPSIIFDRHRAVLVLTGSFETLVSYAMIAACFFTG